nr:hypothetical protein [Methylovulum psychrotolerans]
MQIKQAFMPLFVISPHPIHHGLVVPSGFAPDLARALAAADLEQGKKTLTGARVVAVDCQIP